jgi:2-C-methyl-D-erythritol 4-phosphate cytidylyltransferase
MDSPTLSAVIVAAGSSRRMGFDKLTASLLGRPLVAHSLAAFDACADVASIVLVCAGERMAEFEEIAAPFGKVREVVSGGKERVDSVLAGVSALDDLSPAFVAVHDGARPLITPSAISACFAAAQEAGAAVSAEPVTDTLHRTDAAGLALETVSRENLWRMQTPQIVEASALKALLLEAREAGTAVTDEISLLLRAGRKARVVENPDWNLKVTYPRDLALAEMLLKNREALPK